MTGAPLLSETSSQDWYQDRYQSVFVSRNRWFVTAVVSLGLALLQGLSLALLVPLKTSVPFLIKEETSGAVSTVLPLKGDGSVTFNESVRKYFLARYVILRETYDPADLAENYRAVTLLSDTEAAREFHDTIADGNPHSPIAVFGSRVKRLIRIKSISFLNPRLAQVRLTASEQKSSGSGVESQWIATLEFHFAPPPGLESERLINPLGFFVTHYRIDQEVVS